MISRIARKELKETFREGRFRILAATVIALLMVAVLVSKNYYEVVNAQHTAAAKNTRNLWVNQGSKNPHSAAHYGTYAFKPKYPLSLIDNGVDKYSGVSIYLEAHKRNESQYVTAQDQTALARFGDLTPEFILLFIIPLFIILIGFNAFSKEKEAGTLRLLQSQGIEGWKLGFGKWLGIFIPLALTILPIYLIAALFLSGIDDYGEFNFLALTILFIIYLVYYAVFINITLIVSALSKSSNMAFVSLIAVWIVACLGMPKVATNVAHQIFPYPTEAEFGDRIAADMSGMNVSEAWNKEMKKLESEMLKKYNVDSVSKLPINLDGLLMQRGEEHDAEIYFKHYGLLKETFQNQSRVYRTTSVLSPFLPVRFLSMAVCRTDYNAHWHFADAAEKYRLALVGKMNNEMTNNSKTGDWDYQADPSLWASLEDFTYDPPSYDMIVRQNSANIVALFIWLGVSMAVLLIVSQRIKPV